MTVRHNGRMIPRSRRLLLSAERVLLLFVFVSTVYFSVSAVRARAKEHAAEAFSASAASPFPQRSNETPGEASLRDGEVIGRMEIRALKLSVPILSDYETKSLRDGIGHIPGTANPGGLGTMGLAGHRDTYFRPLKDIRRGMDIRISNRSGAYHYLVDSTEVVQPDAVEVLDIQSRPELTLVTCYPFYYVGSAPRRFIVHAHLLSALPD